MIKESSFSREWVSTVNTQYSWGRSDAQLKSFEKAIMALHLLELLSHTKLPFIFKGGTSLLLLLQEVHRFSVDIDIMVAPIIDERAIATALAAIIEKSPQFIKYEQDTHRESSLI